MNNINKNEALRYLGYHEKPTEAILNLTEKCEKLVCEAVEERYVYRVFAAENFPLELVGNDIVNHLQGCEKIVVLAATIGTGVEALLRKLQSEDMTEAVIADALSSAAIEQVCQIAENEIHEKYSGNYFTWRFSPGYGDFPIDIQRSVLAVLDASKKIGLHCNENHILLPRKSVTAFIGISTNPVERKKSGCASCNLREKCQYRKRGEHCG